MAITRWIGFAAVGIVAGCAGRAAEDAVARAEQAVATVREEGERVRPEALGPLEDDLAAARRAIAAKDYGTAKTLAALIPARAEEFGRSLAERRASLAGDWAILRGAMDANLDSVRIRLDRFAAGSPLPPGVARAGLPAARAVLDSALAVWPGIQAEFDAGHLAVAMAKAIALRVRVSEAMAAVGLAADDRAWGNLQLRPAP